MKAKHCLISMATVLAATIAGAPSEAASDCLSLELTAPASICAGQNASLTASVTNSCPTRIPVSAEFTVDNRTLPVKVGFAVGGDSTLTKSFTLPVPASASAGSHTLTVSLADPAGDQATATIDLSVTTCPGSTSGGSAFGGRGLIRF